MEEKETITLDLTDCEYLGELHERIRTAFDFPEWYGADLDAFWDLLSSECDADEVILTGVNTMPEEIRKYMSDIYKILDRKTAERENYSRIYADIRPFSYKIEF